MARVEPIRLIAAAALAIAASAAGDPAATVDNPQYVLWAKCRPGASVTLSADIDLGPQGKVHLDVTQALKAVTPAGATLAKTVRATLAGVAQPAGPAVDQAVAARVPAAEARLTGTADVQAMGRAFACQVYDVSQPPAARGGAVTHATAYLNDAVPGGVVKLVADLGGHPVTFVLSAVDTK